MLYFYFWVFKISFYTNVFFLKFIYKNQQQIGPAWILTHMFLIFVWIFDNVNI